jgi:hypothetical protein
VVEDLTACGDAQPDSIPTTINKTDIRMTQFMMFHPCNDQLQPGQRSATADHCPINIE